MIAPPLSMLTSLAFLRKPESVFQSNHCQFLTAKHSLYHLDGTQAICHLDALLEIKELQAIEWTPQAGIDEGGDPRWYPMYRKILDSDKALQVVQDLQELVNSSSTLQLSGSLGTRSLHECSLHPKEA